MVWRFCCLPGVFGFRVVLQKINPAGWVDCKTYAMGLDGMGLGDGSTSYEHKLLFFGCECRNAGMQMQKTRRCARQETRDDEVVLGEKGTDGYVCRR